MVFASWICSPEMVEEVRKFLKARSKSMKILAKIETQTAIRRSASHAFNLVAHLISNSDDIAFCFIAHLSGKF